MLVVGDCVLFGVWRAVWRVVLDGCCLLCVCVSCVMWWFVVFRRLCRIVCVVLVGRCVVFGVRCVSAIVWWLLCVGCCALSVAY